MVVYNFYENSTKTNPVDAKRKTGIYAHRTFSGHRVNRRPGSFVITGARPGEANGLFDAMPFQSQAGRRVTAALHRRQPADASRTGLVGSTRELRPELDHRAHLVHRRLSRIARAIFGDENRQNICLSKLLSTGARTDLRSDVAGGQKSLSAER